MLLARALLVTLTLSLLAAPLAARTRSRRGRSTGWVGSHSAFQDRTRFMTHCCKALRELGYVEGQNLAVEQQWAEGKLNRLPALAAELVRLNVDVIVTPTYPVIRAARQATGTISIRDGDCSRSCCHGPRR